MAVCHRVQKVFFFLNSLVGRCREWHSTLYIRCILVFLLLFLLLGQCREWHSTLFIGVSVYTFLSLGWEGHPLCTGFFISLEMALDAIHKLYSVTNDAIHKLYSVMCSVMHKNFLGWEGHWTLCTGFFVFLLFAHERTHTHTQVNIKNTHRHTFLWALRVPPTAFLCIYLFVLGPAVVNIINSGTSGDTHIQHIKAHARARARIHTHTHTHSS
jgi:hypothetical protein